MVRQTGPAHPAFPPAVPAPAPARYHDRGDPWPLYAALDEATLWREWRAANPVATPAERRRLWTLEVAALRVLDLRDGKVVRALGVDLADLVGPRQAARPLADRARALGAEGMVVPSAAHPGGWNLVVFPEGFRKLRVRTRAVIRPPAGTDSASGDHGTA